MVDFQYSEELNERLASYVLGDLTPEEVASVNQLLESHPELATEVSRLQKTLALLPLSLPETSPPAMLGSQILQAARDSDTSSTARVSNRLRPRPNAWLGVAGSIAASVIVGLGLYGYRLHQEVIAARAELSRYEEAIALLRQPSNRLVSLKGTNAIPQAFGSMVVVPSSEVAVLTLQNLAPLPKGQIYRLWEAADGKKIYCGEFKPDSQGKVFVELPLDNFMFGNSSILVTIEPSQKTPQPIGETVMTGGMSL